MSNPNIGIFVATMTGTAELCAEEVSDTLEKAGFAPETVLMDNLGVEALEPFDVIIIISSTYGHGDIPDNGQVFFESVEKAQSIEGKNFAVFGLGDRTYALTFCEAGQKWDSLFARKGGVRIVPLMQHDASGGTLPEDEAGEWVLSWADTLRQAA